MPFHPKTPKLPASMKAVGFTLDFPYGIDSANFLTVINKIISSHLSLTNDESDSLRHDLGVYLHSHSIRGTASMDVMGHPQSWTKPRLLPESPQIPQITPPVIACLAKIAEAMKYAHSDNYYITADTSFKNIDTWTTSVSSLFSGSPPNGTELCNPPTKSSNLSATDIPDFDLPSFTGQAVDGIDWMADVKDVFNNKGLTKYLDDENHCTANLEFSTAFASRLRTSVCHSTVLGHIYALEEKNNKCANLWSVIVGKLCKKGILISQECRYWKQFSHLCCNSVKQFPELHSDMSTVMHRLQQMEGKAISDKNFLQV